MPEPDYSPFDDLEPFAVLRPRRSLSASRSARSWRAPSGPSSTTGWRPRRARRSSSSASRRPSGWRSGVRTCAGSLRPKARSLTRAVDDASLDSLHLSLAIAAALVALGGAFLVRRWHSHLPSATTGRPAPAPAPAPPVAPAQARRRADEPLPGYFDQDGLFHPLV